MLIDFACAQVWYQGESNENSPLEYNCSFPALIQGWRDAWHASTGGLTDPQFPFGFVQLSLHGGLPCYGKPACYNMPTWSKGYGPIRWAQTASAGVVPNAVRQRASARARARVRVRARE